MVMVDIISNIEYATITPPIICIIITAPLNGLQISTTPQIALTIEKISVVFH